MGSNSESLESLCELIVDCPHSTPEWTDDGIIVLRNQNIKKGTLDLSTPSYTNEIDYQKRIKRAQPQCGDIVITREAPMGDVCMIPMGLKCCLGQRQVLLRPKNNVNGEYLFWALQSPFVQNQIAWNEGTGTTVSNIRIPVLKAIQIPRNPNEEDYAAHILTTIGRKLELNKQTNQTLEQMAQALFKSWFVDFDPVFDNAFDAGLSVDDFPDELQQRAMLRQQHRFEAMQQDSEAMMPQTPQSTAVLQRHNQQATQTESERIRGLFPSEFEQCDDPSVGINGWIPKGWTKVKLKGFGKIITGKTPPKSLDNAFSKNGLPFITPTDVDSDIFTLNVARGLTEDGALAVKNNVIEEGSVCVTCIGSQMGKTVIAPIISVTNQQLNTIVLDNKTFRNYVFVNLRLRRNELFNLGSSGSTMPILNKSSFESLIILKPTDDILSKFGDITETFMSKILINSKKSDTLSEIRDGLLPKLISEKITIN